MIKQILHYANVAAGATNTKTIIPANGQSYTPINMTFTTPGNGASAVIVKFDGAIINAAQSDKSSGIGISIVGDAVKKLEIDLNNSGGAGGTVAFLGVTIVYEEN